MKSTPVAFAARSSVCATFTGFLTPPVTSAAGVTEMRLFTMGTPNSRSMSLPTCTSREARWVIRS